MAVAELKALALRYRVHAECIGVAVVALIVFVMLGTAARHKLGPARAEQAKVADIESEIASFRSAFSASTPGGDVSAVTLPDSFAVAVSRDTRVALAEHVASRAEQVGLSDVRVRFAPPDSSAAPARPDLFSATVAVADYAIYIDCAGSFASVLSLVNQLPPSVALQRLTAVRDKTGAHFRLILAVFETAGSAQHG